MHWSTYNVSFHGNTDDSDVVAMVAMCKNARMCVACVSSPDSKVHGAYMALPGPAGPRWAPRWPLETCYLGRVVRMSFPDELRPNFACNYTPFNQTWEALLKPIHVTIYLARLSSLYWKTTYQERLQNLIKSDAYFHHVVLFQIPTNDAIFCLRLTVRIVSSMVDIDKPNPSL